MGFVIVFFGAGLGGAARHGVNLLAGKLFGTGFPVGTLSVNVLGCLAMGIIAEYWALKSGLSQPMRLFLTTGLLGGFTTFSAFSLDIALLWERGQVVATVVYAVASVLLSVAALVAGVGLVRLLLHGAA